MNQSAPRRWLAGAAIAAIAGAAATVWLLTGNDAGQRSLPSDARSVPHLALAAGDTSPSKILAKMLERMKG